MSMNKKIIGKGWAFPPEFKVENNKTLMVEDVEDINQSLYILFTTKIGERVMQPNYGSAMKTMLFENINEHFKTYMRLALTRSINLYEARIKPIKLEFVEDDLNEGRYLMILEYYILETNQKNNFVFPFYLNN